jgi:hypothetical protein
MATVTGTVEPSIQGGEGYFTFSLDGISTSKQMERLITLTEDMVKKVVGNDAESLKQQKEQTKAIEDSTDAIESETEARKDSTAEWRKSTQFVNNIFHGRFGLALDDSSKGLAAFAGTVGFLYAKLENYGNSLGEGLKRGVAGSTFDLAIAAKSAGVSIATFTKALGESGGGFASLGDNATDGAKQFGGLVKNVRRATADVGNLGMNLDEMAVFTAQQTKTAIQQGFKGKAAQDVVIRNSRELGKELDVLASRTGKSVLELAQAAMKLSQDPIVANFVRSMRGGGREVSASIQSFAASMRGLFGEEGDKLAQDALQSAISGLPLAITDTGKNMVLAGSGIYEELERQARKARSQEKITEQDQERLRDLVMKEVKGREQELAVLAQIPGAAGDSARALLKMADQAEFYNSEEGKRDRRRADSAKQFNAELRTLQASLQEMLIPLLKAINTIDWAAVFQVISYIPRKIGEAMDFLSGIIKSLPEPLVDVFSIVGSGLSTFGGLILGAGVLLGLLAVGAKLVSGALGLLGKGLGVLGVTTLPTYISKYAIVNKALDSFTAALMRAGAAAKIDGTGGVDRPQRNRRGKNTPGSTPAGTSAGKNTSGPNPADIPAAQRKASGQDFPSKLPENAKGGTASASSISSKLSKGIGISAVAAIASDVASDMLGRDTFWGKIADTVGTTAAFAGTGAAVGSLGLGFGAIPGAIGGGLAGFGTSMYKNFFSDSAGSMSSDITSQAAEGDNPVLKAQLASIEQQKKTNDQMAELINEQATANRLASMGLGKDDDLARRVSNLSLA